MEHRWVTAITAINNPVPEKGIMEDITVISYVIII